MVVDVIIPVYRPEREKLTKLIDWLNKQTVKPSHVFFMQTLVEEKEDEEVLQMLQKAENVEIGPMEKLLGLRKRILTMAAPEIKGRPCQRQIICSL